MSTCEIPTAHCESCGSTDGEDIDPRSNDGYSSCCNELIVQPSISTCRNHHGED